MALDPTAEAARIMIVKVYKLFITIMKLSARTAVHMSTNSMNFMEQD